MGFNDIADNDPYEKEINFNQKYGIMIGDEFGNFNPDNEITKAELCVFLQTLLHINCSHYKIDSDKIPPHIPSWVAPYFFACRDKKILPSNFEMSLKEMATTEDLIDIFDLIGKNYFLEHIEYKIPLYAIYKSNPATLLRKTCANLIFYFCQSTSSFILMKLADPENSSTNKFLPFYLKYSWVDFFFDPDIFFLFLYQIYYTLKQFPCGDSYLEKLNLMLKIKEIRNTFFLYNGSDKIIYHYTTLKTLEILTKPTANFRLSNAVYLNDPQEGLLASSILFELFHRKKYHQLSQFLTLLKAAQSDASSYFIASFIKNKDSLPMWVHYGQKGAGCCLGIDLDSLCEDVYEVVYKKQVIKRFFSDILDVLNSYASSNTDLILQNDPVFHYAKTILEQSCYLYKDDAYRYEEEVRIVRFVPLETAKVEDIPAPGKVFPKVYWETPLQKKRSNTRGLDFSSITLGPTVSDPSVIATALAQRRYDSSIVQKSKISFR